MKTSLTLAILGGYNALMGAIMLVVPGEMGKAAIGEANAADPKLLELASNFHSGLAPALLMIGLTCLFIRKASIETAKQALLAYIIGTAVLFGVFFGFRPSSPSPTN